MRIAASPAHAQPVAATPWLARPVCGPRYDWTVALLSLLLLAGVAIDIWAHNHGRTDETFFTPWHGLLYGMLAATGIFLAASALRFARQGYAPRRSLPRGYGLSLLGVAIFVGGGVFDLIWHALFGFEADIETLLSPAHLLLAVGGILIVTGPLRSVWRRYPAGEAHGWVSLGPAIVAATLVLCTLTLFTQYAHPFVFAVAEASADARYGLATTADPASSVSRLAFTVRQELVSGRLEAHLGGAGGSLSASPSLGIASVLLQTAILMGTVLLLVRQWQLPFGALLLLLTINGLVMVAQSDEYRLLPVFLVGGLAGDLLISHLRPSATARSRFYLFAFALPVILYTGYFFVLYRANGIAWSTHLWTGSIFTAGIVGLLMSFLLVTPLDAAEAE